jgi:hypothetical protein
MSAEIPRRAEMDLRHIVKVDDIFPVAFGNEEETGLMDDTSGAMDEPYRLCSQLGEYVPRDIARFGDGHEYWLANGSKIYVGGARERLAPIDEGYEQTNLERATAECNTVRNLALAVRASEVVAVKTIENYVKQESLEQERKITARLQRRTVDGVGSRKACHDNYGMPQNAPFVSLFWSRNRMPDDVLTYAASRSIIDGVGYVRNNGLRFSGKIGGLKSLYNYGYAGSMFRFSSAEGNPRIESRDNDINISDWAIMNRIGGMALALAITQTPLADKLRKLPANHIIQAAKAMNSLPLNEDGTLRPEKDLMTAIDIQQRLSEVALNNLGLYVDEIPEELYWVANERYTFCDDLRRITKSEATIGLLHDRADWAAKMSLMLGRIHRDRKDGLPRAMTDIDSRADDMRYDFMEISATDGKLAKSKIGNGYKLREKGVFKSAPFSSREIQDAYRRPIPGSRAELRGTLLNHYDVISCDWGSMVIRDGPERKQFSFIDVEQTSFSDAQAFLLHSRSVNHDKF